MKKKRVTSIAVLFISAIMILSLQSCTEISGTGIDKLHYFYEATESEDKHYDTIMEFLPVVEDESVLDFGINLVDNSIDFDYVIYLKCRFPEERIREELERLGHKDLWPDEKNKVITWWDNNGEESGIAILKYVIWSEDGTFVYVIANTYHPKSVNEVVPEEYRLSAQDEGTNRVNK
ncbi:MAG: hypothetical protein IJS78_01205 [Clostridia bacterium]|nr:hypothetical protein [Clostridia bacterium]